MSKQPEALWLAEALQLNHKFCPEEMHQQAAAELSRLHAENEELREANEAFNKRQEWWNERMFTLEQQCKLLRGALNEIAVSYPMTTHTCSYHCDRPECIKAQRDELRQRVERLDAELRRLHAENEALRADAERYRLLRRGQKWSVIDGLGDVLRGEELDAAIAVATKGDTP